MESREEFIEYFMKKWPDSEREMWDALSRSDSGEFVKYPGCFEINPGPDVVKAYIQPGDRNFEWKRGS